MTRFEAARAQSRELPGTFHKRLAALLSITANSIVNDLSLDKAYIHGMRRHISFGGCRDIHFTKGAAVPASPSILSVCVKSNHEGGEMAVLTNPNTPRMREFAKTWRELNGPREVALQLGLTYGSARELARQLRKVGVKLKSYKGRKKIEAVN